MTISSSNTLKYGQRSDYKGILSNNGLSDSTNLTLAGLVAAGGLLGALGSAFATTAPESAAVAAGTEAAAASGGLSSFLGGLAPSILPTVVGAYGADKNYQSIVDTNKANQENVTATNLSNQAINQANLDYDWMVTQEQWRRDDTSYQRAVSDAVAAGFSPLVASGTNGGQVSSGIAAPNPIPNEAFQAKAPSLNTSDLVEALLGASRLEEEKRHNMVVEGQRNIELNQAADSLRIQNERLKNDAEAQRILGEKQLAEITRMNDLTVQYTKQLEEQNRHNTHSEQLRLLEVESKSFYEHVKSVAGDMPYKIVTTESSYNLYLTQRQSAMSDLLKRMEQEGIKTARGRSDSASGGVSGSVANGVNVGVNASGSHSEHDYEDISLYWQTQLKELYQKNPIPILIRKDDYPEMRKKGLVKIY